MIVKLTRLRSSECYFRFSEVSISQKEPNFNPIAIRVKDLKHENNENYFYYYVTFRVVISS